MKDQEFMVEKIRSQYIEQKHTELDALKELDAKVKKPANIPIVALLQKGFNVYVLLRVVFCRFPKFCHVPRFSCFIVISKHNYNNSLSLI